MAVRPKKKTQKRVKIKLTPAKVLPRPKAKSVPEPLRKCLKNMAYLLKGAPEQLGDCEPVGMEALALFRWTEIVEKQLQDLKNLLAKQCQAKG